MRSRAARGPPRRRRSSARRRATPPARPGSPGSSTPSTAPSTTSTTSPRMPCPSPPSSATPRRRGSGVLSRGRSSTRCTGELFHAPARGRGVAAPWDGPTRPRWPSASRRRPAGTRWSAPASATTPDGGLAGQACSCDVLPQVRDIRRIGSAALDLCAVAAGRLDGYYERGLNSWDMAAGWLVLTEAGATVHRSGRDAARPEHGRGCCTGPARPPRGAGAPCRRGGGVGVALRPLGGTRHTRPQT